ncbi:hypothetical protein AK830_g7917 [Neonectria ditissima]|uniref:Uncharacterized protein n=1 Tax=Neonectria ditissima TaxID=78410 RepID=A0A0P7AYM8_9HYPO|nr:hypothetical protein AK830_g7917 [Neonectria ditissima]
MTRLDGTKIAEALRQTDSAGARSGAIASLGKALRREDRFRPVWDAVGGAGRLAELMAEFSVQDVRALCVRLGNTASAQKARPERQEALGELVRLLYDESEDAARDRRPLRPFYQTIVPACSLEMVQEWEHQRNAKWSNQQQKRIFLGHRELHERKLLARICSSDPKDEDLMFKTERRLFRGNLPFCEETLRAMVAHEGDVRVPDDFVVEFVMPMLKRLLKRRFDEATRNKFLGLVVQCVQKCADALASQLYLNPGGLLQYVMQRWNDAPVDSTKQVEAYLVQLLGFTPINERASRRASLTGIHQAIISLRRLDPLARYDLLRLVLQHLKGYNIDIEDDDESAAALARLRDLPFEKDLWPAMLFFSIDNKNAMRLFERLAKAYPSGDFISTVPGHPSRKPFTVLKQPQGPEESTHADPEVVRFLLVNKSKTKDMAENPVWFERPRALVRERMKKAEQARDSHYRIFWSKSAFSLCIAAGDLDTLGDLVLWARRFNKDTVTVRELYGKGMFETAELEDLLGAIPQCETSAAAAATTTSVKRDIALTDRILVNLIETATMAVQEPGFQLFMWSSILGLPKVIADRRLKNVDSFNDLVKASPSDQRESAVIETVWKPTMDTLLEVEAILRKPTFEALLKESRNAEASGVYVLQRLPAKEASMLAKLARFLLERMHVRLGPERLRVQMGDVVEVVMRVARSDQPSLACPFIRDLILNGDDNSSWHRQLVNVRFISSLPAKAVRELLFTMADAIRDKLREQNSRPRDNDENHKNNPRPSVVKVTTVKMMAQLLKDNVFVDAASSCDILVGLLAEARHIDAQTTIVSSLISTIEEPTCPPGLRTRILDALESYIVPVAAQLSERQRLTEADWEVFARQDETKLPDVSKETPLLMMLVERARRGKLNPDDEKRLAQLIMTALEQSAANNGRWMELFLAKNKFALDTNERLPSAPTNISVLTLLLANWTRYVPASILNILRNILLTNLSPSPAIMRITSTVKSNPDLVNSNAGKHWLAQFDNLSKSAFRIGVEHAAIVLRSPSDKTQSKLSDGEGITVPMLQDLVLAIAEQLLITGDTSMLNLLVLRLGQKRFESRQCWESWRSNCVPVVEDIITRVKAIRSDTESTWGTTAEKTRSLLVLPNTFQLQMMILPIPYSSSQEPASSEEMDEFISKLSVLIHELAIRHLPYHEDFVRLKEEVLKAPEEKDFLRFALKVNATTRTKEPALADYLQLELSGDFVLKASDPQDEMVVRRAREMVLTWQNSEIESIRAVGLTVVEKLKGQRRKSEFMLKE